VEVEAFEKAPKSIGRNKAFVVGIIVIIFLLGAVAYGAYLYYSYYSLSNTTLTEDTISNICSVIFPYRNKTKLNVSRTLVVKSDAQREKFKLLFGRKTFDSLINKLGGEVASYSLSKNENKIAFIYVETAEGDEEQKTDTAFVYDFTTGTLTSVHTMKEISSGDVGYTLSLVDVGFSPDGNLLAITTSTGLNIYDLKTGTIKEIFDTGMKEEGIGGVWAYHSPEFSGDGSKILLSKGFWEGIGYMIYDLKENKVIELPYGGYVLGSYVEGWYKDSLIVQRAIEEGTSEFFIVSPDNLESERELVSVETDDFSVRAEIFNGDIYFVTSRSVASGFYSCNNIGRVVEVTARYENLSRFNIETGKLEELLLLDATRYSGVRDPSYRIYSFANHVIGEDEVIVLGVLIGDGDNPLNLAILGTDPLILGELGY